MSPRNRTVAGELDRMASRSHGVVSRSQLLARGLTRDELRGRVRDGTLIVVHRGVYRVGHRAPSFDADCMAAVLAAGDGAVLSGRTAGHLLGILVGSPPSPEVTAPTERRIAGVRTHRARRGPETERMLWLGIPVTTPARTLVDLAGEIPPADLARACHEAGIRFRVTPAGVEAVLARRSHSAGAGALRSILSGERRVTLSRLEARFLERLNAASMPLPLTNRPAGGRRVDCRWPSARLTVEIDSYRYHSSRHAWELDRRREREAYARGDAFRRYTYGDVFEHPAEMLRELRSLLASPPS